MAQSPAYQRAQTAAEELIARNIELLKGKYALEEKVEGLLLDVDLKDEEVTRLENDILPKDEKIAQLEYDILSKDRKVAQLEQDNILKHNKLVTWSTIFYSETNVCFLMRKNLEHIASV